MDVSDRYWLPLENTLRDLRLLAADSPTDITADVLGDCRTACLKGILFFGPQSTASRKLISAGAPLRIGKKKLPVDAHLVSSALELSDYLGLDEVQAYILLRRWCQASGADIADEGLSLDQRMELCISYFTERSCLLTCVEYILQSQAQGALSAMASTLLDDGLAASIGNQILHIFKSPPLLGNDWQTMPSKQAQSYSYDPSYNVLREQQRRTEQGALLDLGMLVSTQLKNPWDNEKGIQILKELMPLLAGRPDVRSLDLRLNEKAFLLLVTIVKLPNLLKSARASLSREISSSAESQGLLNSKTTNAVSEEILKWEESAKQSNSHYSLLCFAWAAYLHIAESLRVNSGPSSVRKEVFLRMAWQGGALEKFSSMLKIGNYSTVSGVYATQVLKDVLLAVMGSFMLFPNSLPDESLQYVLEIITGIFADQPNLCRAFWSQADTNAPLHHFLSESQNLFPAFCQPYLVSLSALCSGLEASQHVNALFRAQNSTTCRHSHGDPRVSVLEKGETAVANSPIQICHTTLAIPKGTKGKVSPLPAMARQYTQADSEAVNEDILIQWDIALPSGIDFLLALLDAHRRALSKGDTIQSKDSERRSMLNEIQWSLQLLARLAVGDPSNFVCNARISLDPSEMNIVALVTSLMDTLAMFEGQAKVIGHCLEILDTLALGIPSHVAQELSRSCLFQLTSDALEAFEGEGSYTRDFFQVGLPGLVNINEKQEMPFGQYPVTMALLKLTCTLHHSAIYHQEVQALTDFALSYILPRHVTWKYKHRSERWKITACAYGALQSMLESSNYGHFFAGQPQSLSQSGFIFSGAIPSTSQQLDIISATQEDIDISDIETAIESWLKCTTRMLQNASPELAKTCVQGTSNGTSLVNLLTSYITYPGFCQPRESNPALLAFAALCSALSQDMIFSQELGDKTLRECILSPLTDVHQAPQKDITATCQILTATLQTQTSLQSLLFPTDEPKPTTANGKQNGKQEPLLALPASGDSLKPSAEGLTLDAIWEVLADIQSLLKVNPGCLASVLSVVLAIWQGGRDTYKLVESLKQKPGFWRLLTDWIPCKNVSAITVSAEATVLQILALEAYRYPLHKEGKAESEFWTILLAWEKDEQGARIKDLIQRYTKVSPSGKSCLHQVEEASQLAILQIASKILPALPSTDTAGLPTSVLGHVEAIFLSVPQRIPSISDRLSAFEKLYRSLEKGQEPAQNETAAIIWECLHKEENIRLLLEYAKPLTRINDSSPNFGDSYIFDTQRFERAIGPVFVNALPAIKILSSSLREASQEASLVTAQEEALEALTTLVAVTSHEPSEKNIPAIIQSMESLLDAVPAWVTSRPQRLCITTLNPILAASNTSSILITLLKGHIRRWQNSDQSTPSRTLTPVLSLTRRWMEFYTSQSNGSQVDEEARLLTTSLLALTLQVLNVSHPKGTADFREGSSQDLTSELQLLTPLLCLEATAFRAHVQECLAVITSALSCHLTASDLGLALSSLDLSLILQKAYARLAEQYQAAQGDESGIQGKEQSASLESSCATCRMALTLTVRLAQEYHHRTQFARQDFLAILQAIGRWLIEAISEGANSQPCVADAKKSMAEVPEQYLSLLTLFSLLARPPLATKLSESASLAFATNAFPRLALAIEPPDLDIPSCTSLRDLQETEKSFFFLCAMQNLDGSCYVAEMRAQKIIRQSATYWVQFGSLPATQSSITISVPPQTPPEEDRCNRSAELAIESGWFQGVSTSSHVAVHRLRGSASSSLSPGPSNPLTEYTSQVANSIYCIVAHALKYLLLSLPEVICRSECIGENAEWPNAETLVALQEDCLSMSHSASLRDPKARRRSLRFTGVLLSILDSTCQIQEVLQYTKEQELATHVNETRSRLKLLLGKPQTR